MLNRLYKRINTLKTPSFFPLWFLLYPSLVLGIISLFFLEIGFYKFKFGLIENILFSLILYLLINLITTKKGAGIILVISFLIIAAKVFLFASYYYLYESTITASTFFIIFETNISEATEFLRFYFSSFNILLGLTLVVPLVFYKRLLGKSEYKLKVFHKLIILGFPLLFFVVVYQVKNLGHHNLYVIASKSLSAYKKQISLYSELGLHKKEGKFINVSHEPYNEQEIYVLIIGESTTRHHMGIYGYERQTNPELTKIKDELILFEDVISPHTHTIESLKKMMTLNNYENENAIKTGSLLQLMNQAGFKTYWLSNQKPVGWHENLITKVSKAADESYFINDQMSYLKTPYDGDLIPKLEKVITNSNGKSFIVMHLLGTHVQYSNRYPESYSFFHGDAPLTPYKGFVKHSTINKYDNAVLYNDMVVSEIIETVRDKNAASYVLYLSDHGEDVFQVNNSASHTETNGTKPMYDVPFILWTSDKFKRLDPLDLDIKRKYMLDDLIFSISDLSGVKFEGFEAERSIFNESFEMRKRIIYNGLDYDSIFKNE